MATALMIFGKAVDEVATRGLEVLEEAAAVGAVHPVEAAG
jgi:hypothetical protein